MHEPVIIIAGREWRVPLLTPRQNRIVVPALLRLGTSCERQYELLLDIVFAALTRAYPGIVRDELENLPIAFHELFDALPIIALQTGFRLRRNPVPLPEPELVEGPDWDAIIAEVVNFLPGTTPDYWEDALTVRRLEALREQWRRNPPPQLLFAAWLGYRPPPREVDALTELLRVFPTGALKLN